MLTTKGLQERKTTIEWDDGRKIGNKNKLIQIIMMESFKLLQEMLHPRAFST